MPVFTPQEKKVKKDKKDKKSEKVKCPKKKAGKATKKETALPEEEEEKVAVVRIEEDASQTVSCT